MAQKGKRHREVQLESSSPKRTTIDVQYFNLSHAEENAVQDMGKHQQRECMLILQKLMRHQHGWVFNEPVDAEKLGLHDYHSIIKNPMDLGTVTKRLLSKHYASPLAFVADVRLTFNNALLYNPQTNDVHVMALTLRTLFEGLWQGLAEKLAISGEDHAIINCDNSLNNVANSNAAIGEVETKSQPVKRLRIKFANNLQHKNTSVRALTVAEKAWIIDIMEKSPDDVQIDVTDIIHECYPVVDGDEVDIMDLDNVTLWRVYKVLRDHHGESSSTRAHELIANENTTMETKSNDAPCDSTSEMRRKLVEQKSNSSASLHVTGSESRSSGSRPRSRSRSRSTSNSTSSSQKTRSRSRLCSISISTSSTERSRSRSRSCSTSNLVSSVKRSGSKSSFTSKESSTASSNTSS